MDCKVAQILKMFGFLKKILGSKSDKDIKKLYPIVDKINNEFELLKSLSDDELRGKTDYFKDKINKNLQDSNKTISELRESYVKNKGSLEEKEIILSDIDKIKENQKLISELDKNGFVLENKNQNIN